MLLRGNVFSGSKRRRKTACFLPRIRGTVRYCKVINTYSASRNVFSAAVHNETRQMRSRKRVMTICVLCTREGYYLRALALPVRANIRGEKHEAVMYLVISAKRELSLDAFCIKPRVYLSARINL